MDNIRIERISEDVFSGMRNDWNALLELSAANEVFLLWEWVSSWWKAFEHGNDDLHILVGNTPEGKMVGIAPLYLERRKGSWGSSRTVVRFCSSRETAPVHLDFIIEKGYEESFTEAVFRYLGEHDGEWDALQLEELAENGVLDKYLLRDASQRKNLLVERIPHYYCPYLPINQSFDDYLKSFSGDDRRTLRWRRRRLLEKEKADLKIARNAGDAQKMFYELVSLHVERAERKGIKTTFCGDGKENFHRLLIASLLQHDKVYLASLYKDAIPLAANYGMKHNGKYYVFNVGISRKGETKGAGQILLLLIIEQAFAEGCREFDLLRGNDEYKHFWTKDLRQTWSITVRKRNFQGILAHNSSVIRGRTKFAVRSFLIKRWPKLWEFLRHMLAERGQILKGGG